jgi:hypothetical protein
MNTLSTLSSVMIAIRIVPPELPSRDIAKANAEEQGFFLQKVIGVVFFRLVWALFLFWVRKQ